jgi:hypothetical protein
MELTPGGHWPPIQQGYSECNGDKGGFQQKSLFAQCNSMENVCLILILILYIAIHLLLTIYTVLASLFASY